MQIIEIKKNKKFETWIKQQECVMCNRLGSDPHHLPLAFQSRRSQDEGNLVSLCRSCHQNLHHIPSLEKSNMEFLKRKAKELWNEYQLRNN